VEADRLTRDDGAQRLKAIQSAVAEELERSRRLESAASYGYSKVNLALSVTGLAAKIILAATTKNQQACNLVDHVFDTDARKKCPFGTVLVCIGPKGLPDDVETVSISRLARESDQNESDITNKLQQRGCLLFSEKAFSLLIDRLIDGVLEGRLLLPISVEKLSEIKTTGYLNPECKNSE